VGPLNGNEQVDIKTEPAARAKQKPVMIKSDGAFESTVLFDTLKGLESEDCSRQPTAIVVSLRRSGQILRSVRLEVPRDFIVEGWAPDFRVRHPVVLTLDQG
jgi:hypothetical protein